MTVQLLNAPGRPVSEFFHQASVSAGTRTIHVAGQVGTDEQGQVVPGGLAAQAERAMRNVHAVLAEAGAGPGDLVRLTIYVTDWDPGQLPELGQGLIGAGDWVPAPVTLIEVVGLFEPGMRIEIEATAVAG
jgi:enamine deaminase RidA (YjgF/YER057c/UK114 family)